MPVLTRSPSSTPAGVRSLIAGGALLLASACSTTGPVTPGKAEGRSRVTALDEYAAAVTAAAEELVSTARDGRELPPGLAEAGERAVRDFRESLDEYVRLVTDPRPGWKEVTPAEFGILLDESVEAGRTVQTLSLALPGHCAAVRGYIELPSVPGDALPPPALRKAHLRYVERCRSLAALLSDARDTLLAFHVRRLSGDHVAHPAARMLDFLVLERAGFPDLGRHIESYRDSWRSWVEAEIRQTGPGAAMEIVALAFTITDKHPPDSLKEIGTVVRRCIEEPPDLRNVERMEDALAVIEKAYMPRSPAGDVQLVEFKRARAALRLARAHAASNPEYGIYLAIEAFRQDARLEEAVRKFLIGAGQELADKYAPERHYAKASRIYSRALRFSDVRGNEKLASKYRAHLFERALADFDKALKRSDFLGGKSILAEATELASGPAESKKLDAKLYELFRRYAASLADGDVEEYLEVCREFKSHFPRDTDAESLLDAAYIRRMQEKIGDLETSHLRLRAEDVLEILRETTREVSEKGTRVCQKFLREIQDVWSRQLETTEDPQEVFPLAREVAQLAGWSDRETVQHGSRTLNRILVRAAYEENWELLERCINEHVVECPEDTRPRSFKETYLRLLSRLDRDGEVDKLAAHIARFLKEYPGERAVVRAFIEKHLSGEPESAARFADILKSAVPPGSDGNADSDGDATGESDRDGRSFADRLGDMVDRVWSGGDAEGTEEKRGGHGSTGGPGDGSAAKPWLRLKERRGRATALGKLVLATGSVGSVFFVIFLVAWTLKKGPRGLPFYLAGAFWVGMTIGSFLAF